MYTDAKLKKPLVSIVTIVYNGEAEIEKTIKSVVSQTYDTIEYIIIDGGSTDRTVDIIGEYNDYISFWISEKDNGIYDAMNKGNKHANGDYLIFLNAGDFFVDNNVVEFIFDSVHNKYFSLIAGRTKIFYDNKDLGIVSLLPTDGRNRAKVSFSHQGTFIHKSIYKEIFYNTAFSISADREYWHRVKNSPGFSVKFCNVNISSFELGGVSNNHKNVLNRRLEDFYIDYMYEGTNYKKFVKMAAITFFSYLITLNEAFYYKKIYVLLNKIKNTQKTR